MPSNFFKMIELKRRTTFLGRNGTFKCVGLIFAGYYDTKDKLIDITPVTSYLKEGRGRITFAMKDIDRIIDVLYRIKKGNKEYEARRKKFKK